MSEITQIQDTRRELIDVLCELAENDDRIVLIVPDVGFNYVSKFADRFPERYFNFGVTEQATMIIAAAMALSGMKPYVYSMINFVVFRPFEMVRNAIGCHNANVKIIGVQGSSHYRFLGFSHNLLSEEEDIEALKNIPNMKTYIATENPVKVRELILEEYGREGPAYFRI